MKKMKIIVAAVVVFFQIAASENPLSVKLGAASIHDCGNFSAYKISDTVYVSTFWDGHIVHGFANEHFKPLFIKHMKRNKDIPTALLNSFRELDDEMCAEYSVDSYYDTYMCDGIAVVTDIENKELFCANVGEIRAYFFSPTMSGATTVHCFANKTFVHQHGGHMKGSDVMYKDKRARQVAGLGGSFFKQQSIEDDNGQKTRGPVNGVPNICRFDISEKWAYVVIGSRLFNRLFYTHDHPQQFSEHYCLIGKATILSNVRSCFFDAITMEDTTFYRNYSLRFHSEQIDSCLEKDMQIEDMFTRVAHRLMLLSAYGAGRAGAVQRGFTYPSTVCVMQMKQLEEESAAAQMPSDASFGAPAIPIVRSDSICSFEKELLYGSVAVGVSVVLFCLYTTLTS